MGIDGRLSHRMAVTARNRLTITPGAPQPGSVFASIRQHPRRITKMSQGDSHENFFLQWSTTEPEPDQDYASVRADNDHVNRNVRGTGRTAAQGSQFE